MANPKLNQIVAVVKGLNDRATKSFMVTKKTLEKPQLFNGFSKEYTPKDEEGDRLPPERLIVQKNVVTELKQVTTDLAAWLDASLTRDVGNTVAKADVVVDGEVLISDAPIPFLLFLEKQVVGQIRVLLETLPTLDPAQSWSEDANNGGFRTDVVETVRSVRVEEALVLYAHTDKHPAQVKTVDKPVTLGTWRKTDLSGAVPEARKRELLARLGKLHDAVRVTVEMANSTDVEQKKVGESLFNWLLA